MTDTDKTADKAARKAAKALKKAKAAEAEKAAAKTDKVVGGAHAADSHADSGKDAIHDDATSKTNKKKKRKAASSDDAAVVSTDADADADANGNNNAEPSTKPSKSSTEHSDTAHKSGKKSKKAKVEASTTAKTAESTASAKSDAKDGVWVFHESTSASSDTIKKFLEDNAIRITSLNDQPFAVHPIFEFKQAGFPAKLTGELAQFPKPTCIQSVTWPPILKGRDLVGIAATGSGKTLSFGIPGILKIQNEMAKMGSANKTSKRPLALVLSPTRELAMQIQTEVSRFGASSGISSVCIYGGVPKWDQIKALKRGMHIIVATPGRLIDLFEEDDTVCDLSAVQYLVLDEADRMLDQGFEEAIKKIIARLPTSAKGRQTVMFSATWPTSIQKMAMSYLNNPVKVTVGSTDLSANISIEQRVEVLDPQSKESRLLQLLKDYHKSRKNRVLIFALYKKEAVRLEQILQRNGYKVGSIHGDLSQQQRTASIEGFRDGSCPLLIATDVAARGIDIPNVEYVINVTFPLTVEDYCHRIGRTGRAGKTGISHTFFTVHDKAHSGALINVLKQAKQIVPPELLKFGTTVKKKLDPNYGAFAKEIDLNVKGSKTTFASDDDDDDE